MKLINPAPGRPVTSPYGWRKHPISGARKFHRGTDFGGTFDVLAAGDGIVVLKGANMNKKTGGGHTVVIKHNPDLYTVYYHGAQATHLKVGDPVKAGEKIYLSGSTGASTGPHLHFEVRKRKAWGSDTDPAPYFEEQKPGKITIDGKLGKQTWSAVQRHLKKIGYYEGSVDGLSGKLTVSGLQRALNDGKL
jgi:murein DD-endopeptidase MepM/ murein hydrolase activator NlpD